MKPTLSNATKERDARKDRNTVTMLAILCAWFLGFLTGDSYGVNGLYWGSLSLVYGFVILFRLPFVQDDQR